MPTRLYSGFMPTRLYSFSILLKFNLLHYLVMDIDLLAKMIRDVVLEKDEVALPGLGVFVAEFVPASFSDKGFTINPPYKRLTFRQEVNAGDDTLIRMYAEANNIGEDAAARIVNDFLSGLKDILMVRKAVVFPELGKLRATRENNFFFIADENLDIYPEGFGLEPVSLKTHQEAVSEVAETIAGLRELILLRSLKHLLRQKQSLRRIALQNLKMQLSRRLNPSWGLPPHRVLRCRPRVKMNRWK